MKAWFGLPINGLDHFEADVAPETWNGFPVPLVPHVYAEQIAEAVGDDIPGWYDGEKPYDGIQWQLICPECGHELTRTTTVDGLPAYCDYCDSEVLDATPANEPYCRHAPKEFVIKEPADYVATLEAHVSEPDQVCGRCAASLLDEGLIRRTSAFAFEWIRHAKPVAMPTGCAR